MDINTVGTAELLQTLLDTRTSLKKLVVASSMSIYGEGAYLCRRIALLKGRSNSKGIKSDSENERTSPAKNLRLSVRL